MVFFIENLSENSIENPFKNQFLSISKTEVENDQPKCPICLVSTSIWSRTACGHCYCLRCVIRMWNSENDDLEEEDNPNPVICPMCRETVLRFSWTGPSTIPSELVEYNQRYHDYTPNETHSSKKFSSGKFSIFF